MPSHDAITHSGWLLRCMAFASVAAAVGATYVHAYRRPSDHAMEAALTGYVTGKSVKGLQERVAGRVLCFLPSYGRVEQVPSPAVSASIKARLATNSFTGRTDASWWLFLVSDEEIEEFRISGAIGPAGKHAFCAQLEKLRVANADRSTVYITKER